MCMIRVSGTRVVPAHGRVGGCGIEHFSRWTGSGMITATSLEGVDGVTVGSHATAESYLQGDASWSTFDRIAATRLAGKQGAALSAAEILVHSLRQKLFSALTTNVSEAERNYIVDDVYRRLRGV